MLRPRFKRILGGGIAFVLLVVIGAWFAGSLLSKSSNHSVGDPPSDLGATSVQFPSASGTTIHGWLIAGQKDAGAVLLLHGIRGSRHDMIGRARFLKQHGYTVLLIDLQAHGESLGKNITFGYLESKDAQAAIGFLRTRAPGEKIGVLGVSLGGAAAILTNPPLQVDAVVLEMVYPTIDEAVGDRLAMRLGSWSKALTPLLVWQLKPRLGISAADLRPINQVGTLQAPKLFVAGEGDQHTTVAESRALYAAAAGPKELWVVPGARHQDLQAFAGPEYEAHILAFFDRTLR